MSVKQKRLLLLLVSALVLAVTTAQAASPAVVKKAAVQPNTFTLSHGANTLRAVLVHAPPVYDPGGPICFVEDWSGDESLLANAEQEAAKRGAVVVRVICPHDDAGRAEMLAKHGYKVASEWYTAPLPLANKPTTNGIRLLTAADVPRVLELGEQTRRQYAGYSPVFWRMSALPRAAFAPYMQSQVTDAQNVALAHEQNGELDGFVLVNARGTVDDYAVAVPDLWPTVGAGLLRAAADAAQKHGLKSLLVVCGHGDIPKRTMLMAQGLTLATAWYVKPLLPKSSEKK